MLDAAPWTTRDAGIAGDLGYRETAFVIARDADGEYDVRYFSPEAEVPFCGHATIATAVALAERDGDGHARLPHAGRHGAGRRPRTARLTATLTSVAPHLEDAPDDDARPRARRPRLVGTTSSTRSSRPGSRTRANTG